MLNLDTAFKNFFEQPSAGFPRYKKFRDAVSIVGYASQNNLVTTTGEISMYRNFFKNCASRTIPVRMTRPLPATQKHIAVTQDAAGRYFVSILVEDTVTQLPMNAAVLSVDLGITNLLTDQHGQTTFNPRLYQRNEERLKYLQQVMSRKVKGDQYSFPHLG